MSTRFEDEIDRVFDGLNDSLDDVFAECEFIRVDALVIACARVIGMHLATIKDDAIRATAMEAIDLEMKRALAASIDDAPAATAGWPEDMH